MNLCLTAIMALVLTLGPASAEARNKRAVSSDLEKRPIQKTMVKKRSAVGHPRTIGETEPLMRIIPQRDGTFVLQPLPTKERREDRQHNRLRPQSFPELLVARALLFQDARYCTGGSLEYGSCTDCSGFTQFIYRGFMLNLPRSSAKQAQVGKVVTYNLDFSRFLPGDLLFFRQGGRRIGHAGIYLGEGRMIHATNRGGVTVSNLEEPYFEKAFVVAKRVFEVDYSTHPGPDLAMKNEKLSKNCSFRNPTNPQTMLTALRRRGK